MYNFVKKCMSEAGFDMTKWYTNSGELMQYFDTMESKNGEDNDESYAKTLIPGTSIINDQQSCVDHKIGDNSEIKSEYKKVLGVLWDGTLDKLVFDLEVIADKAFQLPSTKRSVLSVGAKLYDPMGLMSPIFVKVKVLFQKLCLDKGDWDNDIPEQLKTEWLQYITKLKEVKAVSVPRFIFSKIEDDFHNVVIHGFSDSSKIAYSAVVYLQIQTSNGLVSRLMTSKTKVAPIQELTIPRLELLACLLLANLVYNVCNAISNNFQILKKIIGPILKYP